MQSYLKTLSVAGGAGQIIKMSGRELCRALSEYIWQRQSSSHYADLVNKVIIRIRNTIRIIPSSQSVSMYSLCRANICRPQKLGLCQEAQTWSGDLLICSDLYDPGSWLGSGSLPKSHSNLLRPRNFVKVHPQVFLRYPADNLVGKPRSADRRVWVVSAFASFTCRMSSFLSSVLQPNCTFTFHPAAGPTVHQDRLFRACFPIFSTVCLELAATNSSHQRLSVYFQI